SGQVRGLRLRKCENARDLTRRRPGRYAGAANSLRRRIGRRRGSTVCSSAGAADMTFGLQIHGAASSDVPSPPTKGLSECFVLPSAHLSAPFWESLLSAYSLRALPRATRATTRGIPLRPGAARR